MGRAQGCVSRARQWDPERDLFHNPLPHRAIQIGLGPEAVPYVNDWIKRMTDMTAGRMPSTRWWIRRAHWKTRAHHCLRSGPIRNSVYSAACGMRSSPAKRMLRSVSTM